MSRYTIRFNIALNTHCIYDTRAGLPMTVTEKVWAETDDIEQAMVRCQELNKPNKKSWRRGTHGER